jgi:uncharacterized protein
LDIVRGRWGPLEGHVYAFLAHGLAQLEVYRQEHDPRLLQQTQKAMDFLTRGEGLVISGCGGEHECWHDTQSGTTNLAETCATAYLLRTLDSLLRLEGDSRLGDLMERSIFNGLFAAQSPDGRRLRYYTPFECPREYFSVDSYCCPNNYRRIVSQLPTMVYYRAPHELTVSLYMASSVKADLGDGLWVNVRQETDYPNSGKVLLVVEPSRPAEFSLRLRIPGWCHGASVRLNDTPAFGAGQPGKFYSIGGNWRSGDRVELNLPMPLRLVRGRQSQAGRVAVMRGPMLFGLNRERNKELGPIDLRLLTASPKSLEGPVADNSVRPGGMACRLRAWKPGAWYPYTDPKYQLTLTEYADPGLEFLYFHVPNPLAKELVDDELAAVSLMPMQQSPK